MMTATDNDGWAWWASDNNENYTVGPCATRDEAIAAAISDELGWFEDSDVHGPACAFTVIEARNDVVRLADGIDVVLTAEFADELVGHTILVRSLHDEPPHLDVTPDQRADFTARIKQACDDWQAAHGLVFTVRTFSQTRNMEELVIVLPEYAA